MTLHLRTLGTARIDDVHGASVDFPVGKPFGILVYLALADRPVHRDELAELFWNKADRARARHSVRQALSYIRRCLGAEIFTGDDPLSIESRLMTTDVAALDRALEAGDIREAEAIYGGPFLGSAQLAASPEWEHWVDSQRRILAERMAAVLHQAGVAEVDPKTAVERLGRAVDMEPHRARHRTRLIDRLLEHGDLVGAQAALARAHQAELDAPEAVADAARRVDAFASHRGQDRVQQSFPAEFVGRSAELARLTERWRRTRQGRREIAILSGPTGIGKTRLSEELAAVVAAGGGQVAEAKASASERRLEWGATAELVQALYALPGAAGVSGGTEAVLRSLVPTLGSPTSSVAAANARPIAIADALADLIQAVAYEAPLLLVLDDMQWVDRSSVTLLLRTARRIRREPVMIVFTFRSEEVSSRGFDYAEQLVREEDALLVPLTTLTLPEVEELLSLSGLDEESGTAQPLAKRLYQVSGGHPLFIVELLRSLQDQEQLIRDGERWRLEGPPPDQLELPPNVQGVIARRVERLSEEARSMARELATGPRWNGLDKVRSRTGLSDADFSGALNELLARDVVRWDAAGRLAFTHDQLRESLGRKGLGRRWRRAAFIAAAAIVMLGFAGLWGYSAVKAGPAPYGGGTLLVVVDGDSVVAVDPASLSEGATMNDPFGVWFPRDRRIYGTPRPRRLTDGRLVWFGYTQLNEVDAPEAAIFWGPDDMTLIHQRPGDDGVMDVSPTGAEVIWSSEDLTTPEYDRQLRIGAVADDTGRIITPSASAATARWSPDGSRIAARVQAAVDTLILMTPGGDRLGAWTYFDATISAWCGNDRVLLLVRKQATERPALILLDIVTGEERLIEERASRNATCSPDGSAFIGSTVRAGGNAYFIEDLETSERRTLDGPFRAALRIHWIPDAVDPVAVALRTDPDSVVLERGETRTLIDSLVYSDGSRRAASSAAYSLNPTVASVLSDGSVTANNPGVTTVVREHRRWLADTVRVIVVAGDHEALVMDDPLERLDPRAWYEVGDPTVAPAIVDDQPALQLLGDGRYADGIVSRSRHSLRRGATAELELRMPLTARERQTFALCLAAADPPHTGPRGSYTAWTRGAQLCAGLPAFILDKWSPRLLRLGTRFGGDAVAELPESTDLATWTHIAVQIRPDGEGSIWVDHQHVVSLQVPAQLLEHDVRVAVIAGTAGTEGYIRNFAWWAEPRFR